MTRDVAIIPARGGSKRLPRKNVLPIAGRPMLSYPVRAALASGLFDATIVSTEDKEIASAAVAVGAEVSDRTSSLSDDVSTIADVCLDLLDRLEAQGRLPERFCCVLATAIFLRPEDFVQSRLLLEQQPPADGVLGVCGYRYHPFQALRETDGFLSHMWPDFKGMKSQQFPLLFASNGTLVWMRTDAFRRERGFYGNRLRGYDMPEDRVVDIDTPEDLVRAQGLAQQLLAQAGR